jgi:hypothetical protein
MGERIVREASEFAKFKFMLPNSSLPPSSMHDKHKVCIKSSPFVPIAVAFHTHKHTYSDFFASSYDSDHRI